MDATHESWSVADYAALVPIPRVEDDKTTRGRLLVVGGAPGMTGAVCLAAEGALRSGAGYITVAVPAPSLAVVEVKLTAPVKRPLSADPSGALLAEAVDEVLGLAASADAVVVGPGLGRAASTVRAVLRLIAEIPVPLLVDADALHALGTDLSPIASRAVATVLTPHSGEAARLLGTTRTEVDAQRERAAEALAVGRATVILKGHGSLISGGGRMVIDHSGGPELATLGTGDVLAGIVGALLASGMSPLHAAALGTYLHGRAGASAAADLTPVCCTAEDVVAYLPEAFRPLLAAGPDPRWRDAR